MQKILLGIHVVLDIMCYSYPEPAKALEITERLGMQGRYLEQIFQQLVRANIISSVRGPKGGYVLARERRNITLANIVRSLQEDEIRFGFGQEFQDIIMPIWKKSEDNFLEFFEDITLDDLLKQWKDNQSLHSLGKDDEDDITFSI